jgi:hypothetical protein
MPTPDSTPERDSLIQMLREEVVLEYTARYSEHRDLDVEATADNILASDWLAAHDRDVAAKALEEAADAEADWTSSAWRSEEAETVVKLRKGLRLRAASLREEAPRA